MILFPAIDLFEGKAVRLYKGDYAQMTVYSEHPEEIARDFTACGATHIHLVDLEGARSGETPNLDTVLKIRESTGLFCEIGGGIRSMEIVERYLSAGLDRVILGTAAIENEDFLRRAVEKYGDKIATGADIRDGYVSVKGWTEQSGVTLEAFCEKMEEIGVSTVICTDISRDGAMRNEPGDVPDAVEKIPAEHHGIRRRIHAGGCTEPAGDEPVRRDHRQSILYGGYQPERSC